MKSASLMLSVEATSPPTLTCEPAPNSTPFGLTRKTLPFAFRLPRICEASGPVTRLSATEFRSGWTKVTVLPAAISKLCQLSAADLLVCVTVSAFAPVAIVAAPTVTEPPVGSGCACAFAWPAKPIDAAKPSSARRTTPGRPVVSSNWRRGEKTCPVMVMVGILEKVFGRRREWRARVRRSWRPETRTGRHGRARRSRGRCRSCGRRCRAT